MPSVSPEILNARSQKDDQFPQCFEGESYDQIIKTLASCLMQR